MGREHSGRPSRQREWCHEPGVGSREDGEGWTGVRRGTVREKRNYTLDYEHHEPLSTHTHTAPEYLTWKQMEGEGSRPKDSSQGWIPPFTIQYFTERETKS